MKAKSVVLLTLVVVLLMLAQSVMAQDVPEIGIIQLVEHPALSAATSGMIDGLAEAGFVDGETIKIDFQNAQGDQANLMTISDRFVQNKVALILAVATPAAQAVASATTDIPILATAITDFVDARLVESNDAPNTNVSGTTDMQPIQAQLDLLVEMFPDAKTVGIIYNSSEANSELQVKLVEAAAEAMGLKIEKGTITSVNDIDQVASSMVKDVDVFYEPTDNTIASAMPNLVKICEENQKAIFAAEPGMVEGGALATAGIDYYKLGKQTGEMAARILNGEAEPASMPIESLKDAQIHLNQTSADAIGYEFSAALLEKAVEVY